MDLDRPGIVGQRKWLVGQSKDLPHDNYHHHSPKNGLHNGSHHTAGVETQRLISPSHERNVCDSPERDVSCNPKRAARQSHLGGNCGGRGDIRKLHRAGHLLLRSKKSSPPSRRGFGLREREHQSRRQRDPRLCQTSRTGAGREAGTRRHCRCQRGGPAHGKTRASR